MIEYPTFVADGNLWPSRKPEEDSVIRNFRITAIDGKSKGRKEP